MEITTRPRPQVLAGVLTLVLLGTLAETAAAAPPATADFETATPAGSEGQEVLIEAVARLRGQGRAVTGLLVGDGNRRAALERLAARHGVAKHVVFTGNVPFEEVAGHYAQIDLFVVPRVDDRAARMVSPLKPFEAMAMRVPLLVADLPALSEIVDDGRRGGTFHAGDPDALAAAAARLMDDAAGRERFVDAASAWVASDRSWTAVADAFGAAYDEVLWRAPEPRTPAPEEQAPARVGENAGC